MGCMRWLLSAVAQHWAQLPGPAHAMLTTATDTVGCLVQAHLLQRVYIPAGSPSGKSPVNLKLSLILVHFYFDVTTTASTGNTEAEVSTLMPRLWWHHGIIPRHSPHVWPCTINSFLTLEIYEITQGIILILIIAVFMYITVINHVCVRSGHVRFTKWNKTSRNPAAAGTGRVWTSPDAEPIQ